MTDLSAERRRGFGISRLSDESARPRINERAQILREEIADDPQLVGKAMALEGYHPIEIQIALQDVFIMDPNDAVRLVKFELKTTANEKANRMYEALANIHWNMISKEEYLGEVNEPTA